MTQDQLDHDRATTDGMPEGDTDVFGETVKVASFNVHPSDGVLRAIGEHLVASPTNEFDPDRKLARRLRPM